VRRREGDLALEIASPRLSLGLTANADLYRHALIIDGREHREHGLIAVLASSRAARLLKKDPRGFGATVKRLYLSGPAGGAGLRELLVHDESMDTWTPTSRSPTPA